ncbi:MAG: hypothetical protein LBT86_06560 [Deltaproteobacteria bacterium]|nr:hypothetical protein [Deltaproteobacteria bacterium]
MPEVDASLQELFHADQGHSENSLRLLPPPGFWKNHLKNRARGLIAKIRGFNPGQIPTPAKRTGNQGDPLIIDLEYIFFKGRDWNFFEAKLKVK